MTNTVLKDRKGFLLFLGVIEIIVGVINVGFVALIAFVMFAQSAMPQQNLNFSDMIPAILLYSVIAAFSFSIGIGTLKCKNWARKLMIVFSAYLFAIGVVAFFQCVMLDYSPIFDTAAFPESGASPQFFLQIFKYILLAFMFVFFVLVPGLLLLAYSGKNVAYTFQKYDSKTYWTDRVPLPVLGLCFLLISTGLFILPLLFQGMTPILGALLVGIEAQIAAFLFISLFFIAGYLCYKQTPHAWKFAFGIIAIFSLNSSYSFSVLNMERFYAIYLESKDIPNQDPIALAEVWYNSNMIFMVYLTTLLSILYALWARSFFTKESR